MLDRPLLTGWCLLSCSSAPTSPGWGLICCATRTPAGFTTTFARGGHSGQDAGQHCSASDPYRFASRGSLLQRASCDCALTHRNAWLLPPMVELDDIRSSAVVEYSTTRSQQCTSGAETVPGRLRCDRTNQVKPHLRGGRD